MTSTGGRLVAFAGVVDQQSGPRDVHRSPTKHCKVQLDTCAIPTVVFVIALLAWLAYHATGSRFSGDAATPSDIPIVGNNLSELVFVKPANFRGYEHPHGGGTFTITGTATHHSVVGFCDSAEVSLSKNGTEIADRDDIIAYLENREIEFPKSSSNEPPDVLFGYGGRFRKLYGVYDAATKRFVISVEFDGSK